MKRKSIQFITGITAILIILFSSFILELQIVKSEFVHSENSYTTSSTEVEIKDFSDFSLFQDRDTIESNISDSNIYLKCIAPSWFHEYFILNFSQYLENCTNMELTIEFNYDFSNSDALLEFQLGSYYYPSGEKMSPAWWDESDIGTVAVNRERFRVRTDFKGDGPKETTKRYSGMDPINSATIYLKKQRNSMKCSMFDSTGKILVSKKWYSSNYYIPANFFLIGFYPSSTGNSVNITDIDGTLTFENIDWQSKLATAKILTVLAGTIIPILVLANVVWFVFHTAKKSRIKRRNSRKDRIMILNEKGLSNEEYLIKLESALK
ncbi:MAG: hypothetical protein ACTSQK_13050 [Candidatus Heimdallarchaeota archaeon]